MLTVFCNAGLPTPQNNRLQAALAARGHRLQFSSQQAASNLIEGGSDPAMFDADVAFGQPSATDLVSAPRLKLIQITSAGYGRYDHPALRASLKSRDIPFCTASTVFAEPCAQHVLAFMYAQARQLPTAFDTQRTTRAWPSHTLRPISRLLTGQSVLIVGYGSIAARVIELLAPLKMKIKALRRNVRGDERCPTYPIIAADELLPDADHVLNILPGTLETERFFDARKIALLRPTATFYNIGRGTTVDQSALSAALHADRLGAAYLDVTTPEPLDVDSPLWSTPRCHITPHTAGGFEGEFDALVDHFLANLDRFEKHQPLHDRVM